MTAGGVVSTPWAAIAACTAFTGEPATDARDGAAADAPLEAPDGGARPFCASLPSTPTFCADFDEGPTLLGFDEKVGSPQIVTTESVSPHGSLEATGDQYVKRTFARDATSIMLSFQVRTGGADGGPPLQNYSIVARLFTGTRSCDFSFALGRGELEITSEIDGGETATDAKSLLGYPVPGVWTPFTLSLAEEQGSVKVRATAAGVEVVPPYLTACTDLRSETRLVIGLVYADPANEVHIDDVVLDLQ